MYHQVAFGMNRISFKEKEMRGEFKRDPFLNFVVPLNSYNLYQLSYFVGNKRMFKEGIYLNTGLEFSLFFRNQLTHKSAASSYEKTIPKLLADEIMLTQVFEVKIGIGKIF